MSYTILGISCFFHDSAACLIKDGEIIAAAQEERFTRIKNDSSFPRLASNYCLEEAGIEESSIDCIAFYENTKLVLDRIIAEMSVQSTYNALKQFDNILGDWDNGKLNPEEVIRINFPDFNGKIKFVEHHHAHSASAFYPSPYNNAAILTIDGVGEWSTASISHGKGSQIELLKTMNYPNSLGLFYSAATYFLGFKINSGEYKVMGLAPYGEPIFAEVIQNEILRAHQDGSITLNNKYFNLSGIGPMITNEWVNLFRIPRRKPETALEQVHFNIAASIQYITENVMVSMARHAKQLTGAKNLCLSGGVALNCVGNGKILKEKIFDNLWIQPASGDAGSALGAALAIWNLENKKSTNRRYGKDLMSFARLGPAYTNEEIIDFLNIYDFPYQKLTKNKAIKIITDLIEKGQVVGLFDGRMEFGPRALGARSIIGDARNPEMQKRMNLKIKFRESFRPFAPVIREENVSEWFELNAASPYMLLVADIKKSKQLKVNSMQGSSISERLNQKRSVIPAVTHVNQSARIQTVSKNSEFKLRKILDEFYKRTGVPVLINTSFNLRSEPIVMTPQDAYRCMMRSEIDAILLEDILLYRKDQPKWTENELWSKKYELD